MNLNRVTLAVASVLTLTASYAAPATPAVEGGFSGRLAPLGASLQKGKAAFQADLASTLERSRSEAHEMIDRIVDGGDLESFLQAMASEDAGEEDLAAQLRAAGPERARTLLHSRLERKLSTMGQEIQSTLAQEDEGRLRSSYDLAFKDLAREETNLVETLEDDEEDASPAAPMASDLMPSAPSDGRRGNRDQGRRNRDQARSNRGQGRGNRTQSSGRRNNPAPVARPTQPRPQRGRRMVRRQQRVIQDQQQLIAQQQRSMAQQQRAQRNQQRNRQQSRALRHQNRRVRQQQQNILQRQRANYAAQQAAQQNAYYQRQVSQQVYNNQMQAQYNYQRNRAAAAQNVAYNNGYQQTVNYQRNLAFQQDQQRRARRRARKARKQAWLQQQAQAQAWASRCNRFERYVYGRGARLSAPNFPAGYYYRPDRVEKVIKRGLWGVATVAATPFALLAAMF